MPPSGFDDQQARDVPKFLRSCWAALRKEGEIAGLMPEDALRREIDNIDAIVDDLSHVSLVGPVLATVRRFYALVIATRPTSYVDGDGAAETVCARLQSELAALHVPDARRDCRPSFGIDE